MKPELISQFIDDELDLGEKIQFVETVHGDRAFTAETLDLLHQEQWLRSDVADVVPPAVLPLGPRRWTSMGRGLVGFASGLAAATIIAFMAFQGMRKQADPDPSAARTAPVPYRFVVYQPDVRRADIIGSFTGWQPVSMTPVDGYWELVMPVEAGEHRFSYIFDGRRKVPDPTIPAREADDFGGENSILEVRRSI